MAIPAFVFMASGHAIAEGKICTHAVEVENGS